jgi:membrane protein
VARAEGPNEGGAAAPRPEPPSAIDDVEALSGVSRPPPSSARRTPAPPPSGTRDLLFGAPPDDSDVLHPRGRIAPPLPTGATRRQRLGRAVVRLGQGLHFHDAFRAAPAMAFHFFLSLLPLLVFIGYVVGLVARSKGANAVLALVLDYVPATPEALLKEELGRLAGADDRLGPLAAVGFFWIASGGIHGLMDAVEMVVGAPRRAWWRQRLHAFAWVVATLAFMGVTALAIIQWDAVMNSGPASSSTEVAPAPPDAPAPAARTPLEDVEAVLDVGDRRHGPEHRRRLLRAGGERLLVIGFSLLAAVGGLAAFYRLSVTHSRRVQRRALPGALLAVVLWIVVSWGFGLYMRSLVNYTVYYGSLAAVAVLLVWLWLMSLAILVGAELNAQLEGLRDVTDEPT